MKLSKKEARLRRATKFRAKHSDKRCWAFMCIQIFSAYLCSDY